MTIGDRMKEIRNEIGLTADTVAFRCGYKGKSRLSNYENNERNVPIAELINIASVYEPILGDWVLYYIITGKDYREQIENYKAPELTVSTAVASLKSILVDMVETGRIRIEPGLDASQIIEQFTKSFENRSKQTLKAL